MPSDLAYWLISAPSRYGDTEELFNSVKSSIGNDVGIGAIEIPELKVRVKHSVQALEPP
jgi:hypothetical protein